VALPIVSDQRQEQHVPMPICSAKADATAAAKLMDRYCASHPSSPAAERRPSLSWRNNVWVALLGRSVQDGVVGFGLTIEAALRAFDVQYRHRLGPQTAG
jgi:hypothetical protein